MSVLKDNERLDDLQFNGLKIIQHQEDFRFSLDTIILIHFMSVRYGERVIDLGTGTGIIPLLLSGRTKGMNFCGLEIQSQMVDMARRSVALNGLEEKVNIIEGDIKDIQHEFKTGSFDVVVTNPPYMTGGTGKVNSTDRIAIARHEILCTLDDVVRACAFLVKFRGRAFMVHRAQRLAEVITSFKHYGLEPKRLRLVHSKIGSKPHLVLIEGLKGGNPSLDILPPLIIYDHNGDYTEEIKKMYF